MRSQQQIFQNKGQFEIDINQLMSGITLDSEFYSYKITVLNMNSALIVQNSAVPLKDGLKAYTGIVYAIAGSVTNSKITKSILCESNVPTKALPSTPKKQDQQDQQQDEKYDCPDAYINLNP